MSDMDNFLDQLEELKRRWRLAMQSGKQVDEAKQNAMKQLSNILGQLANTTDMEFYMIDRQVEAAEEIVEKLKGIRDSIKRVRGKEANVVIRWEYFAILYVVWKHGERMRQKEMLKAFNDFMKENYVGPPYATPPINSATIIVNAFKRVWRNLGYAPPEEIYDSNNRTASLFDEIGEDWEKWPLSVPIDMSGDYPEILWDQAEYYDNDKEIL